MQTSSKATAIRLFSFSTPQMRAFHVTWFAFFVAFFAWFAIAPLMAVVREDLGLSKAQVSNTVIASVAVTIACRLLIGWLCDRIGPRISYSALLIAGSIPVMLIGLARDYETFVLFRLAIGVIGASFVLTQYHTSLMFAPNVVGTANATTAGWGNLGGGVTHLVMPLLLAGFAYFGVSEALGWRLAMVVPGVGLLVAGIAYYWLTQDTPEGNFRELRRAGKLPPVSSTRGGFMAALRDPRVWALFVIYGACFGMELTITNIAALYYHDRFELSVETAALIAAMFGLTNIFARTLGGVLGDRAGMRFGLRGRALFLGAVLVLEGLALMVFAQMSVLLAAIAAMVIFGIFVEMGAGATYAVVPFINRRALGSVSGIVGAGGNAGAVMFGFFFRFESLSTQSVLFYLGIFVLAAALLALTVRFSEQQESEERRLLEESLGDKPARQVKVRQPRRTATAAMAAERVE